MKKACSLFYLSILCFWFSTNTNAQFYRSFENNSLLESGSAAVKLNDGFVYAFTQMTGTHKVHNNILLLKTSTAGNILWSKIYDAGEGLSLQLSEMISTSANEIVITGLKGPDNNFDETYRCVLKINANGKLLWANQYLKGRGYNCKGLCELKDSTIIFSVLLQGTSPTFIQINKAGKILTAKAVTNRDFQEINSITAVNNTADIIIANSNKINFDFDNKIIAAEKQYGTSNQFTALLSSRCKNGDLIYLAGRKAGGVLEGNTRIFRTTANGILLWAKNIDAYVDTLHTAFSRFDIVTQVLIHEEVNGNISALMQAESTQSLLVVLSSKGKYLYNRVFTAPFSFLTELNNGSYLFSAANFSNTPGDAIFANRFFSSSSNCDSTIFVNVKNGTDSSVALNRILLAKPQIKISPFEVNVEDSAFNSNSLCSLFYTNSKQQKKGYINVQLWPNPAKNFIYIKTDNVFPVDIYSVENNLNLKSTTNRNIDISKFNSGIYFVNVHTSNTILKTSFIKE